MFNNAPYSLRILSASEVTQTTPVFWDEDIIEVSRESVEFKISFGWYAIIELGDANYLSIDLDKGRLGRCYQTFWDSYAVIGETPIVANSFCDLLEQVIKNQGEYWWFLNEEFVLCFVKKKSRKKSIKIPDFIIRIPGQNHQAVFPVLAV